MKENKILAINPGSTSTKLALYEDNELCFEKTLRHTAEELGVFRTMAEQLPFRYRMIMETLREEKCDLDKIAAVVGRGGLVDPIESGIYEVNELMKSHLANAVNGEHASNLGALLADKIIKSMSGAKAYIVDPVVVDELQPVARLSGHPLITRKSIFHALNQKAVSRIYAASIGRNYEDMNLVVAHMGGGISVGAHRRGRVVDVNNALNGDGPYAPERSGALQTGQLVDLCFSGQYSHDDVKSMLAGKGGFVAYLGTNDFREASERAAAGDKQAALIVEGCSYQIAKEIGAMAIVLGGDVDAIILTGGLAYDDAHIERIRTMTGHIAPIYIFPGEDELKALAFNGLLAVTGRIEVKEYKG